jgi:hypothetical protein
MNISFRRKDPTLQIQVALSYVKDGLYKTDPIVKITNQTDEEILDDREADGRIRASKNLP